jgi:serine/threonine-protein kinase
LLALPDEYFDGTYTSLTDMFYLAELFKRLLVGNDEYKGFTHQAILEKMMNSSPKDRFSSFSEIQQIINTRSFDALITDKKAKAIYQAFSNALVSCLACFTDKKQFCQDIARFQRSLQTVLQTNCLEDDVQDNTDFIETIVLLGYKYYPNVAVQVKALREFDLWFSQLSTSLQDLVFSNLIAKISSKIKNEEIDADDLPF